MEKSVRTCLLFLATILVSEVGLCVAKDLSIAAFNVQVFGQTKSKKTFVMDILVKIILRYDIVLIQEIRDAKETAIYKLKDQVNAATPSNPFDMEVSPRMGRTHSKEQYAFLYRKGSGLRVENMYIYDDGDEKLNNLTAKVIVDTFEREPMLVLFSSKNTVVKEFTLGGIHIAPDEAVEEIKALKEVYVDAQSKFKVSDVMIMGDFNADCSYVRKSEWAEISLKSDPSYHWLLGDDEDTTVAKTHCAYDRFVGKGAGFSTAADGGVVVGSARVFNYHEEYKLTLEQALEVSDHFPIEFKLKGVDSTTSSATSRLKTVEILNAYVQVPGPSLKKDEMYFISNLELNVAKPDGTVVGYLADDKTKDKDIRTAVKDIILGGLYKDWIRVQMLNSRKYRKRQLCKIIFQFTNANLPKAKRILDKLLEKYGNVRYH